MDNYPLGAANDSRAPYNQVDPPEIDVDIWVSTTLSRSAVIRTNDYKEGEPDMERDEEGFITGMRNLDFSNCNFLACFQKQHYTLKELLDAIVKLTEEVNQHGLTDENLKQLNRLSKEAELWEEDEIEAVEA